jgi:murein L,D-transpeptidase YcbB/YkuD
VEELFSILANNSGDIEDAITQIGGISVLLRIIPDLYRIGQTAMKNQPDPRQALQQVQTVLAYNNETKERVTAWQTAHGLEADGIVGNATWDKVEQLTSS